jgi:hypothetical protein
MVYPNSSFGLDYLAMGCGLRRAGRRGTARPRVALGGGLAGGGGRG